MSDTPKLGFIGLGDMGAPMAANLCAGGRPLWVYDKAGTEARAPAGATAAADVAAVARAAEVIFVSVPDGAASLAVAQAVAAVDQRVARALIDLSTVGVAATRPVAAALSDAGIEYVDAPVSGGKSGAAAGTITIMWSGSATLLDELRPALAAFSKSVFCVGAAPGQGQALKLLNNFLSAVAMAATSEAVLFGLSHGLDMKTMLDAVNVSTGQNTASRDKFPQRILTGSYDAGFRMPLMAKDVKLYLHEVGAAGTPDRVAALMAEVWRQGLEQFPDGDFTEIYKTISATAGRGR